MKENKVCDVSLVDTFVRFYFCAVVSHYLL